MSSLAMSTRRILITGCAGLIGFHLSRRLLEDGYKVIGLDNLINPNHPSEKLDKYLKIGYIYKLNSDIRLKHQSKIEIDFSRTL